MSYTRSEIVSGLFVLAAVVLFAMFAFRALPVDPLGAFSATAIEAETILDDSTGVTPGSRVTVAGHEVGRVTDVELVSRQVETRDAPQRDVPAGATVQVARVRFRIEQADLRLDPDTASVRVTKSGVLGRSYLALDPGHWRDTPPPRLSERSGQTLNIEGESSAGLSETIASLKPVADRLRRITRKLDQNLLTKENLQAVGPMMDNLKTASARVKAILREGEGALDRKALEPLHQLLTSARQSMSKVRARLLDQTIPRFEKLMQDGSQLTTTARTTIEQNQPRVKQLLEQAVATARTAEQRLAAVSDDAEALLEKSNAVLTDNRAQVAETVRRARRALWQAEMSLRKIRADPSVLLFGDDERLFGAEPYDAGWLRRTGRAEPYQQRDEND